MMSVDTIAGVMWGTALGDALGLRHEGLHPRRVERRLARRGLVAMAGGLVSDDTEHTCMVARALADASGDVGRPRSAAAPAPPAMCWSTTFLRHGIATLLVFTELATRAFGR